MGIGTHPYLVHYVLPDGPNAGECRPAAVVREWTDESQPYHNLLVFADGANDGVGDDPVLWKTSVYHGPDGQGHTWHTHGECEAVTALRAKREQTAKENDHADAEASAADHAPVPIVSLPPAVTEAASAPEGTLIPRIREFLDDALQRVEDAVTGGPSVDLPPPTSLTLVSVAWPHPDRPLATFHADLPSGADEIWFYHAFGDPYAPELRLIAKSPTGTVTVGTAPYLLTPGGPYTLSAFAAQGGHRAPVPLTEQFEIPAYEAPGRFPEPLAWAQGEIVGDALQVSILVGPPGGATQAVRFIHTKDPDIADTGAFMLTIDSQTAQALGLPNLGAADVAGVGGAASGYYTRVDIEFPGNGHRSDNVNAVVIDGFGECLIGLRYAVDRHLIVAIDTVKATLSYYQAA